MNNNKLKYLAKISGLLLSLVSESSAAEYLDTTGQYGDINGPLSVATISCSPLIAKTDDLGEMWKLSFCTNTAYECSNSGHQTYIMAVKGGNFSTSTSRNLLTFLHGGGAGYFRDGSQPFDGVSDGGMAGSYDAEKFLCDNDYHAAGDQRCSIENSSNAIDEEALDSLWNRLKTRTGVLNKMISNPAMNANGNLAVEVMSMCNHDVYSGVGQIDANNPYGVNKTTNGLLHVRSAMKKAVDYFKIKHNFILGTSYGSVGVMNVLTSIHKDGHRLSAAILDSGMTTRRTSALVNSGARINPDDNGLPQEDITGTNPHPIIVRAGDVFKATCLYPSPFKMQVLIRLKNIFTALLNLK